MVGYVPNNFLTLHSVVASFQPVETQGSYTQDVVFTLHFFVEVNK